MNSKVFVNDALIHSKKTKGHGFVDTPEKAQIHPPSNLPVKVYPMTANVARLKTSSTRCRMLEVFQRQGEQLSKNRMNLSPVRWTTSSLSWPFSRPSHTTIDRNSSEGQ